MSGTLADPRVEARLSVLEEIARTTRDTLVRLEASQDKLRSELLSEMRLLRTDIRGEVTSVRGEINTVRGEIAGLRAEYRADFRWLLGIMLGIGGGLLGALAKGFHWF